MNNISKIIYNNNKKWIDKLQTDNQRTNKLLCNYRNKKDCSMGGMCNSKKMVYSATIFPMGKSKENWVYIGILGGNWKQWVYNNWHSFSNPLHQTVLLRWFWNLRDRGLTPKIKLRFIKKPSTPENFNSRCHLCLKEKISIIKYKFTSQLLNKCNELIFKCCYKNRFKLIRKRSIIEKMLVITKN